MAATISPVMTRLIFRLAPGMGKRRQAALELGFLSIAKGIEQVVVCTPAALEHLVGCLDAFLGELDDKGAPVIDARGARDEAVGFHFSKKLADRGGSYIQLGCEGCLGHCAMAAQDGQSRCAAAFAVLASHQHASAMVEKMREPLVIDGGIMVAVPVIAAMGATSMMGMAVMPAVICHEIGAMTLAALSAMAMLTVIVVVMRAPMAMGPPMMIGSSSSMMVAIMFVWHLPSGLAATVACAIFDRFARVAAGPIAFRKKAIAEAALQRIHRATFTAARASGLSGCCGH